MNERALLPYQGIDSPQVEKVRVWDPLLRVFHWSLASGFALAYLTEDDVLSVHVVAGYAILALVAFRVLWGFVGPRHARWSDFVKPPGEVRAYLKEMLLLRAPRHLGHNPAGGAMVVALLLSITATAVTGLVLYGGQEMSGPLALLLGGMSKGLTNTLEEVHEVLANLTLLLVVLHVIGVAVSSLLHRENLVRSMIDGRKRREEP